MSMMRFGDASAVYADGAAAARGAFAFGVVAAEAVTAGIELAARAITDPSNVRTRKALSFERGGPDVVEPLDEKPLNNDFMDAVLLLNR
ncbi:MAG: hypothetical protein E6J02_10365 [Chloroflexi bacterium]|nr:MAG: hypothetical protein E6J02_10365 [Chloroflexota bacterium]